MGSNPTLSAMVFYIVFTLFLSLMIAIIAVNRSDSRKSVGKLIAAIQRGDYSMIQQWRQDDWKYSVKIADTTVKVGNYWIECVGPKPKELHTYWGAKRITEALKAKGEGFPDLTDYSEHWPYRNKPIVRDEDIL